MVTRFIFKSTCIEPNIQNQSNFGSFGFLFDFYFDIDNELTPFVHNPTITVPELDTVIVILLDRRLKKALI